jgi:predicted ATP-dependent serine protease
MGVGVAGADPKAARLARRRLLGRDHELERLFGMIDQIGSRGGALVVRGEAGIGKSALLEAVGERAREHGATVVMTTGTQSEARLAFGARDIIRKHHEADGQRAKDGRQ